jgi:hypothetical protein
MSPWEVSDKAAFWFFCVELCLYVSADIRTPVVDERGRMARRHPASVGQPTGSCAFNRPIMMCRRVQCCKPKYEAKEVKRGDIT